MIQETTEVDLPIITTELQYEGGNADQRLSKQEYVVLETEHRLAISTMVE